MPPASAAWSHLAHLGLFSLGLCSVNCRRAIESISFILHLITSFFFCSLNHRLFCQSDKSWNSTPPAGFLLIVSAEAAKPRRGRSQPVAHASSSDQLETLTERTGNIECCTSCAENGILTPTRFSSRASLLEANLGAGCDVQLYPVHGRG